MSFTIVTNVFCDGCCNWDSESGGAIGGSADRAEAWSLAKKFGWKKINGRHVCPHCQERLAKGNPCTANACFCFFSKRGEKMSCSKKEVQAMRDYVEFETKFYGERT
jgi:hypothetical protein